MRRALGNLLINSTSKEKLVALFLLSSKSSVHHSFHCRNGKFLNDRFMSIILCQESSRATIFLLFYLNCVFPYKCPLDLSLAPSLCFSHIFLSCCIFLPYIFRHINPLHFFIIFLPYISSSYFSPIVSLPCIFRLFIRYISSSYFPPKSFFLIFLNHIYPQISSLSFSLLFLGHIFPLHFSVIFTYLPAMFLYRGHVIDTVT